MGALHQPARLREHEILGVARPHRDQLAVSESLPGRSRRTHHAQSGNAFVLHLPVLQQESVNRAVVVFVLGAYAPESRDLIALFLRQFLLRARLAEDLAEDIVVDRGHVIAHHRLLRDGLALGARRARLAPLAIQKNQQLLARGLHAILPQRELGRRFAFAQQSNAVFKTLGQAAHIEIARIGDCTVARARKPLGRRVPGDVDHQGQHAFVGHGLRGDVDLFGPALEQETDE